MAQLFRDCCASEFSAAGYLGLACLWWRALRDLIATALCERLIKARGPVLISHCLTPRALRSLEIARQEVERAGRGELGPEHVLLGLIGEGTGNLIGKQTGVAGYVLRGLSANVDAVRDVLKVQPQPAVGPPTARHDFVPALILRAEAEAQRLGHSYVGTEHLLLGLIIDKDPATEVFMNLLGVSGERVQRDTLAAIGVAGR
jgi:ATP-dependent Clp protease ATP-binding subunit ClpC